MNGRRIFSVIFTLLLAVSSHAEVTTLPFFQPEPRFCDEPTAFPDAFSWIGIAQSLDQRQYPDTAHGFDTGSSLTFFANRNFAIGGMAREIFQFSKHPDGDMKFLSRALVSDLRLTASLDLRPLIATVGYRHDCKHDIGTSEREVIHDALFARLTVPRRKIPLFGPGTDMRMGLNLESECNVTAIFQNALPEPDRARFSAECELVPFTLPSETLGTFLDGRVSLIDRQAQDRVTVDARWNTDWLCRAGVELKGKIGGCRLYYETGRLTDDWAYLDPRPSMLSNIAFLFFAGL